MRGERQVGRRLGLLKVRVLRGVNLATRDIRSSDPYVVLTMGRQKIKTGVVKKNLNPEWNEELTLSVEDATLPVRLEVFDWDLFSMDDSMGYVDIDIQPLVEAAWLLVADLPNDTVIRKLTPSLQNCLVEESLIKSLDGDAVQDIILRLTNVECGEVELQLRWIALPGSRN